MSFFDDVIEPAILRGPKIPVKIFKPTEASNIKWKSKDGRSLTIGSLSQQHLENAHRLLGSRLGTDLERRTDFRLYSYLRAEINTRKK